MGYRAETYRRKTQRILADSPSTVYGESMAETGYKSRNTKYFTTTRDDPSIRYNIMDKQTTSKTYANEH